MLNDALPANGRLRNDPQAAMLQHTKRPEELGGSDLIGVPLGVPLVVADGPDDQTLFLAPSLLVDVLACLVCKAMSHARLKHQAFSCQRPFTDLFHFQQLLTPPFCFIPNVSGQCCGASSPVSGWRSFRNNTTSAVGTLPVRGVYEKNLDTTLSSWH
jgi:hypothetical protein